MKLTVREAARLLSVSESELYHRVSEGEIPFTSVNHQPVFHREELLEWATERRRPLSIELFADEGQDRVLLAAALDRGGIHYDVGGTDIPSTLRAVIACLPIADEADREMIFEIMVAREADAATGIGGGIAIPHVRAPLVFAGQPAAIALCFLDHAVPFEAIASPTSGGPRRNAEGVAEAIDGKPVTTVFAMMTPTIRNHLQLLSHLSLALHDGSFTAVLQRRADRAAILAEAQRIDADFCAAKAPSA